MLKNEDFGVFFNIEEFAEDAEYFIYDSGQQEMEKIDDIKVIKSVPGELEESLSQILKSNLTFITESKYDYSSYEYIMYLSKYYMIYRAVKDGTGLTTLYLTEDYEHN